MDDLVSADERIKAACENHEQDLKATITKLDCEGRVLKKRMNALDEKILDTVQPNDSAAGRDMICLNAGGKTIAAKRSVLTQMKGTKLEAMFGGRWDEMLQRDSHGRIFLDVNPICFQAIVDCLNEMAISSEDNLPDPPFVDAEHIAILMQQLNLFGLSDEMSKLEMSKLGRSDIVRDPRQMVLLHDWLKEESCDGCFRLLYSSSRDGLSPRAFHSKCDDKGCTITIIETCDGYVLGGYSNAPWKNCPEETYKRADKAFLFALSGEDVSSPCKIKLEDTNVYKAHILCSSGSGPSFADAEDGGGDNYLHVGEDCELSFEPGESCNFWLPDSKIKEMEVFAISTMASSKQKRCKMQNIKEVKRFSDEINGAINAKQKSLVQAEEEMTQLENSFKDEHDFISTFASGDTKDIILLNVSGTVMATRRSTLQIAKCSVLAQQFDDSKWTNQSSNAPCVKGWSPDEVSTWAESIEGIEKGTGALLKDNGITGCELLGLTLELLKMMGIKRAGTLGLLLKGIESLKNMSRDASTLIEHSPYCFGKILDFLRLKQLHSQGLIKQPAFPIACESQRKRFEKVVKYYFPGEDAKYILG